MTDKAKLIELADACERATGPEYALDCAIWDAIYPGERDARFDKMTAKGQPYHMRLHKGCDMDGYVKPLRSFTASIDAALTLMPEGKGFAVMGNGAKVGRCIGAAATPALALTAACLRAIAGGREP